MAQELLISGHFNSSKQVAEMRLAAEMLQPEFAEHLSFLEYQCMVADLQRQQGPLAHHLEQELQLIQRDLDIARMVKDMLDKFIPEGQKLHELDANIAAAYAAEKSSVKAVAYTNGAHSAPHAGAIPHSIAHMPSAAAAPPLSAPNAGRYNSSAPVPSYPLAAPAVMELSAADRDHVARLQRGGPRYSTTKVSGVGERDRYWTRDPVEFLDMLREYAAPLPLAVALSVVAEDLDADVRDRLAAVGFSGAMPDSQAGAAFLAVLFGDAQPKHLHRWTAEQLAGKPVPAVLRTFLSHLSRLGPVEALQSGTLFKAEFARTLSVAQCIPRKSATLLPALLVDSTVTCANLPDLLDAASVAARPGACRFCAAIGNARDADHRIEECQHLHQRLPGLAKWCAAGLQIAGVARTPPGTPPLARTQLALMELLGSRISLYDGVKRAIRVFEAFTVLNHDTACRDEALGRLWALVDNEQGGSSITATPAVMTAGGFGAWSR
ncbi:hypothetical protein H9P43_005804 [Blastocladiella emersonii ATCC 22665]|nr:hypothetical protein H9P43_005804 [Blastocladiella emersonii ATCC 22665]